MKKLISLVLVSALLLLPSYLGAVGIPTFDLDRIMSIIAQYVPIMGWWTDYLREFEGGDGQVGLLKIDKLMTKNLLGSLAALKEDQFKALFNDTLVEFQQTFLSSDYYKSLLTDAMKEVLQEILTKSYEKDVMNDKILRGNHYYAQNPKVQAEVDQTLKQKKEIYEKLITMSQEMELRGQTDQQDQDRFRAVCDYIDQMDKGKKYDDVGNQHELVILFAALQNEEIQVNRSMLEVLRSLYELDIYQQLEGMNDL